MHRRLPSLVALRAFEAAARLGSFKAAAEELSVTPTAISHQIRTLEEQLQIALFTRRTRSIELTEAGIEIAPAVTRAFGDISQSIDVATARNQVITLSTTPSFAALFLVPRLVDFYQKYPQYSVQLDTGTQVLDLQRNRHIDLVIRYGNNPARGLTVVPLLQETFGAYISPALVHDEHQWGDLPLIETQWQQNVLAEVNWQQWLVQAGVDDAAADVDVIRFQEESHVLQAATAGKGIALASSVLAADFIARDLLVPFHSGVQLEGGRYQLMHRPESDQHTKVNDFVAWVQSAVSMD
ncbi:Glycine cleavage system transcriptional activator [BD1-7 clade bacterium]|nr:Glycine cleavage system transcriptional activator [BD1-7 clade bacterium]